jgi:hypothetical protein
VEWTAAADSKTSAESGISIEEQQGETKATDSFNRVWNTNYSEVAKNASPSIIAGVAPDSNATASSDLQPAKQLLPSKLTVDGIQIDLSDEHWEKALFSIRESFDPVSNVTVSSREPWKKTEFRENFN